MSQNYQPSNPFRELTTFCQDEILPAITEIEKLQDRQRIHIQKLVYTNVVDRFDHSIDTALLALVVHPNFQRSLLNEMREAVTSADLIKALLAPDVKELAIGQLQERARLSILRNRHAVKVQKVSELLLASDKEYKVPRVNVSTGHIIGKVKPHSKIPTNIIGYADWLYIRRNAVVHGGGASRILSRDETHMKQTYGLTKMATTVKLSLGSIKNTVQFYSDLCGRYAPPYDDVMSNFGS